MMQANLYAEMYRVEQRHWWFAAKRRIVLDLLGKFARPHAHVADLGCGCGMMLRDLQDHGYRSIGVDQSDLALKFCRKRGLYAISNRLEKMKGAELDAVLLLDVLEHIDDDKSALASVGKLLRPGGIAICTVPAYQWLWTNHDETHHHKRRYSKRAFVKLLSSAKDLHIVWVSFTNSLLFLPAMIGRLAMKWLRSKPRPLRIPRFGINSLLKWIFQSERYLLPRLPFGLSLIAVMVKK